jgi:FkbM family methyltransferase
VTKPASRRIGPEVVLFSVVLVASTFFLTRSFYVTQLRDAGRQLREAAPFADEAREELAPLAKRYGPGDNSEHHEEWVIRDFFQDKRDGFFVDVGANHYQHYNNTYYLDVTLGWSGIAIEPQTQFGAAYATHRPRTRFRPFFVSDVSDAQAKLYVVKNNPLVTSADRSFTERYGKGDKIEEMTAPTITLNDLLASEKVQAIDFLNMDIELWEPKALAGFDVERFRPALVCVEGHEEVRQQILDYFAQHRYVIAGKYLRADAHNLYFTPAAGVPLHP